MEMRPLGNTGLEVSSLGAGLHEIGQLTLANEAEAARILNGALAGGITFLDTSACYGLSEELIGRTIARRRHEFILATKCGHLADGYQGQEFSAQTITASIDRSLQRMRTDYLDLVQLHSCEVAILERGEAIQALLEAQQAGKTRFIGYSGDNEAAQWAVDSGRFDTLQTSFNLVDQRARRRLLPAAKAKGMGLIIKRPLANGAWGAPRRPSAYAADYFERGQLMANMGPLSGVPEDRIWLALGFTLAHPNVDTAIVGTRNPEHMQANIKLVETQPPLTPETIAELHRRFDQLGQNWPQLR
jgi:aryl-alcohol dehydrogenase-like predicted oxidoreductase